MTRSVSLVLALALLSALSGGARAQGTAPEPDAEKVNVPAPPLVVTLGFHIFDVRDVDLRNQSFVADLYMWMRYPTPASEERAKAIEALEFMNGRVDVREELDRKAVAGQNYVCWRVGGTFHFKPTLRNYPFDTQSLPIEVEHPSLETDEVLYDDDTASYERSGVPGRLWGVKEGLDIPEFTLKGVTRRTSVSVYRTDFGDPSREQASSQYSRFTIAARFGRDFMPYVFKIVIPLVVIIAMAYLVFFLPPKEIQTASGLAITSLLSCIAFNVSVSQNLPEVGYLVVSDKFFICTYALLFLTLLQSVLTYVWDDAGKTELARTWDVACRFVFPILYVGAFAYLLFEAMTTA